MKAGDLYEKMKDAYSFFGLDFWQGMKLVTVEIGFKEIIFRYNNQEVRIKNP